MLWGLSMFSGGSSVTRRAAARSRTDKWLTNVNVGRAYRERKSPVGQSRGFSGRERGGGGTGRLPSTAGATPQCLVSSPRLGQQLRQLGGVRRDPPCLVAGQTDSSPSGATRRLCHDARTNQQAVHHHSDIGVLLKQMRCKAVS